MSQQIAFRLPVAGWPRAVFESDYGLRGGRLVVEGRTIARVRDRASLERGVQAALPSGERVDLALVERDGAHVLSLHAAGRQAPREDQLGAPTSRSAWVHAFVALAGSVLGFVAGWLYLIKAEALASPWALKMAYHTAGWHLLLTLTLFPASVMGQRIGIRAVQLVSAIFFCIHVGIAIANAASPDSLHDGSIALLNAASGVMFLVATVYGQRAHRDMDPLAALLAHGGSA